MNSSNSDNNLKAFVENSLQHEKLSDIKYTIQGNTEKGDGYLGDIVFITASGKNIKNEEATFDLVLKCAKSDEKIRRTAPISQAFQNEIFSYQSVMPLFRKFQTEKIGRAISTSTTKCFNTFEYNGIEVLALENLRKLGYSLYNRLEPMNLEHIKLILGEYGKYHGTSFALKDQRPEVYAKLIDKKVNIFQLFIDADPGMVKKMLDTYRDVCEILKGKVGNDVYKICVNQTENIKQAFSYLLDIEDAEKVISHGDCWNNNFMFQYNDDRTKPLNVKILDWQMTYETSPVYDLSYFIYAVSSKKQLAVFDDLLKTYYDSLSTTMNKLGSNADKIFPYETLLKHWKICGVFGLGLLPTILKFALCNKNDIPDIYEVTDLIDGLKINDEELYNERVLAGLEHYANFYQKF